MLQVWTKGCVVGPFKSGLLFIICRQTCGGVLSVLSSPDEPNIKFRIYGPEDIIGVMINPIDNIGLFIPKVEGLPCVEPLKSYTLQAQV